MKNAVLLAAVVGGTSPYPPGIAYVIVNGVVTVTPTGHTGWRADRRILGPGVVDVP